MVEICGFVIDTLPEGLTVCGYLLVAVVGFFIECLKEKIFPKDRLEIFEREV